MDGYDTLEKTGVKEAVDRGIYLSKKEYIMDRPARAREYMATNYNCAQSIVKAFAIETGMSENEIIHLAFPFGGGFGRQG